MHTCITKCLGRAVVRVKTICPRQHAAADGERAATLPIDSAEPKPVGLLTQRRADNVALSQSPSRPPGRIPQNFRRTDYRRRRRAFVYFLSPFFIYFFPEIFPGPWSTPNNITHQYSRTHCAHFLS